jgi:hypothetical protein
MVKNARVRTLRDLDLLEGIASLNDKTALQKVPEMKIAHIPDLPQAEVALHLLRRIHKEFYPIAQRRGYRVLSLSEMCCCGDGLNHVDGTNKRRKRVVAHNVLGYNQSTFNARSKSHTIHLRLRNARNHAVLLDYESIAGTMAHELAHCEHGPHNAAFYKLMDEIQEQHAVFQVRGIVADQGGFPLNSNQAYVLGGKARGNRDAARRRQEPPPQRLGGDVTFQQWLTPGEAAAAAAEARRLEDETWCLPCAADNLVELVSDSEEEEDGTAVTGLNQEQDSKLPAREPAAATTQPSDTNRVTPTALVTIDLTGDSDEEPCAATMPSAWSCVKCTFRNDKGMMLVCSMCGSEKQPSQALIYSLVRENVVESVRLREVEQSERDFGFNIYGNGSSTTANMKHIT